MSLFSILTVLAVIITSVYSKIAYAFNAGNHSSNRMGMSVTAVAIGGIIVCISNFMYLILFGLPEEESSERGEGKAAYTA